MKTDIQKMISGVGRNGPKSKAWGDLCAIVKAHLADLGPHERLTTRELITELEWDDLASQNQALWQMRKHGGISEDYYEQDHAKRAYGHPLIKWKAPPKGSIDTSIF